MTSRVAAELPHSKDLRYGEILGFIAGDGSLGKTDNSIAFTNSESYCIGRMLDNFLLLFGIGRDKFHYYISMPLTGSEAEVIKFWRCRIGSFNFRVNKYKKTKKRMGWFSARIHDKVIRCNIKQGIQNIFEGKEVSNAILIGFLKGFFAAEGAIIPGKTRREIPNSIQFPQKGRNIPESISKILWHFGIENRVVIKQKKANYYCVNITGFENFKKLHDLNIVGLHPEKAEKLERGLQAYTKVVSRKLKLPIKLLRALNKKPMTRPQIYDFMDSYPQKINGMLYSKTSYLVKNKLITKEFFDDGTILWNITDAGLDFLRGQE